MAKSIFERMKEREKRKQRERARRTGIPVEEPDREEQEEHNGEDLELPPSEPSGKPEPDRAGKSSSEPEKEDEFSTESITFRQTPEGGSTRKEKGESTSSGGMSETQFNKIENLLKKFQKHQKKGDIKKLEEKVTNFIEERSSQFPREHLENLEQQINTLSEQVSELPERIGELLEESISDLNINDVEDGGDDKSRTEDIVSEVASAVSEQLDAHENQLTNTLEDSADQIAEDVENAVGDLLNEEAGTTAADTSDQLLDELKNDLQTLSGNLEKRLDDALSEISEKVTDLEEDQKDQVSPDALNRIEKTLNDFRNKFEQWRESERKTEPPAGGEDTTATDKTGDDLMEEFRSVLKEELPTPEKQQSADGDEGDGKTEEAKFDLQEKLKDKIKEMEEELSGRIVDQVDEKISVLKEKTAKDELDNFRLFLKEIENELQEIIVSDATDLLNEKIEALKEEGEQQEEPSSNLDEIREPILNQLGESIEKLVLAVVGKLEAQIDKIAENMDPDWADSVALFLRESEELLTENALEELNGVMSDHLDALETYEFGASKSDSSSKTEIFEIEPERKDEPVDHGEVLEKIDELKDEIPSPETTGDGLDEDVARELKQIREELKSLREQPSSETESGIDAGELQHELNTTITDELPDRLKNTLQEVLDDALSIEDQLGRLDYIEELLHELRDEDEGKTETGPDPETITSKVEDVIEEKLTSLSIKQIRQDLNELKDEVASPEPAPDSERETLRKRIETDSRYQVSVNDLGKICPYCRVVVPSSYDFLEHILDRCDEYLGPDADPLTEETLKEWQKYYEINHWINNRKEWSVFDQEGHWYCPFCASRTRITISEDAEFPELYGLITEHFETCPEYGNWQDPVRPLKEILGNRINYESTQNLIPKIEERLESGNEKYTQSTPDGKWICPICLSVLSEIDTEPEEDFLEEGPEAIARHLVEDCRAANRGGSEKSLEKIQEVAETRTGQIDPAHDSKYGTPDSSTVEQTDGQPGDRVLEARKIQENMLPDEAPDVEGYEIAFFYQPHQFVGGDFYDFLELPAGNLGIVVGDVSGKGTDAALVMSLVKKVLTIRAGQTSDPLEALVRTNSDIRPELEIGKFVSCGYSVLNPETGEVAIARAGHNEALHYVKDEKAVNTINPSGAALNLHNDERFQSVMESSTRSLNTGDVLLFYTDGLIEGVNDNGEKYGAERVRNLLQEHGHQEIEDCIRSIVEDHRAFVEEQGEEDDVTIVAVRKT